eukprot:2162477-Prymnesium_polylepis.1
MTPKIHIEERDVINYVRLSTNRKKTCILPYESASVLVQRVLRFDVQREHVIQMGRTSLN